MSMKSADLTFEGGVNVDKDPHTLKSNEWQSLQNMWPYKSKLIGSRPSLLHEQDVLPVGGEFWNYRLFRNIGDLAPTQVPYYYRWFRHLTPLKALFLGERHKLALICVCTNDNLPMYEQFEGEDATTVTLKAGDVILMVTPNDLRSGETIDAKDCPMISGVRLGSFSNVTPSLIDFNGEIIAVNKTCDYVVKVVKTTHLTAPSVPLWSNIDYRFTKVNFGDTNTDFKPDGVVVYKNRFVYFKGNKLWFSDPFQPEVIYDNAMLSAYLGVFFNSGFTEDITAMAEVYMSTQDTAGTSMLAVWTNHAMITLQGEPATTIASTPEEIWSPVNVTTMPLTSGCISQASVVKTKYGIIWCGAESVWFMARGNLPVEVGQKISPRIRDQNIQSSGRIFASFEDEVYRLTINAPGVGFNAYEAMNEMWCLSFIGDLPSKDNAAWFGPQVFTNTDNQDIEKAYGGGSPGIYCCAKLTTNNDDKTWYIQPYSFPTGDVTPDEPAFTAMLGLATLSTYYGVDVTAPFRSCLPLDDAKTYNVGEIVHLSRGKLDEHYPYCVEYKVITEGIYGGWLTIVPVYANQIPVLPPPPKPSYTTVPLYSKRPFMVWLEATEPTLMPKTHKIQIQSPNMTLSVPELKKLVSGLEITFKTLNPVLLSTNWWPWEPAGDTSNVVLLQSPSNVPAQAQNVLGGAFNEPVLTSRRIQPPKSKRYNGLTAQLNITEPEYKIVTVGRDLLLDNPNWGKIKLSFDDIIWYDIHLFTYDSNNIAKYVTVFELYWLLYDKVLTATGYKLDLDYLHAAGTGYKITDDLVPLYIDLSAQGWEWFGFVPTNLDVGHGMNIVSNVGDKTKYIRATGPIPPCTPHSIHLAKLTVRYRTLDARPR